MAKKKQQIEIIARGVFIKNDHVLLCHTKGARNTYLPGGHTECFEPATRSLSREIKEELGRAARVGRFLGAVEHHYCRCGERCCEINLIFEITVAGISPPRAPESCEDYIEFWWTPLSKIARSKVEPAVLRKLIVVWARKKNRTPRWASTYGENC